MKIDRLSKVLEKMKSQSVPQFIVSDPASIFYLTGKWIHPGERLLVLYLNINGDKKLFINELFPLEEDIGVEKIWYKDTDDAVEIISKYTDKNLPIGIDKNWPARFLLRLMELKAGSNFVNGSEIIDRIRMCKDDNERNLMREASRLNDKAIEKLIKLIPEGYTEKKMGKALENIYESLGAEGFSFDPIVAYGVNAADPHHETDNSILKEGEAVTIDIGYIKDSYCSDMTRTVFYKYVPKNSKKVYNTVLEANKRGIEAVKPGVRFCDIDKVARDYIDGKGYGRYFTHRTGHSIGIECHDLGDVSSANSDKVQPGMIFSIEPGIYIPGEIGVRIEDLVLVTEDGCEVLNKYSKDIIVVE
ncbi:aminopeptidase P family protein [Clostridium autoethanogenum]|uniref:Aminopeptidase P family protein n=1 Tax=Clostridium autoethanogenum TaxID=84023 RepID=A0A3M0SJM6_9CLOT|nr:Xaa-Pro peptidase family protein [Clostridium autoethanogenum]RMC98712.1 aminopeptidase P family protein [Clostridium autoethanogenum]